MEYVRLPVWGNRGSCGGRIKYATEKPSNAKLMRETFESLGSTYINSVSLLPAVAVSREYVEEFQGCLDQTPTLPFSYSGSIGIRVFWSQSG